LIATSPESPVLDRNGSPAVRWHDVAKVYPDGHEAVAHVSLDVKHGELLALLGTSGSGKTTLLKMVNRLVEPTSGEVVVQGKPTADWDPIALRRSIGYVIQDVGLMPHLSVLANVTLVPRLNGVDRESAALQARKRLELVGLAPDRFATLFPHQLSGGQRQRVGVARALAGEAELILMDEPFGALDPITRRELQAEFRDLQRRLGKTVVLVTHDLREACRMADRLALLDRGRLVQEGRARAFLDQPATPFVREFFREAEAVDADLDGSP
jgi:osmoprotectant transport system ATP-binding protein